MYNLYILNDNSMELIYTVSCLSEAEAIASTNDNIVIINEHGVQEL